MGFLAGVPDRRQRRAWRGRWHRLRRARASDYVSGFGLSALFRLRVTGDGVMLRSNLANQEYVIRPYTV